VNRSGRASNPLSFGILLLLTVCQYERTVPGRGTRGAVLDEAREVDLYPTVVFSIARGVDNA
jgi:hypothetical protein